MADGVVADGHVRDLTNGAEIAPVATLILWCQQDGEADLREPTPGILHDVSLEQNALCIFQLEEILDNEWTTVFSTHVSRLPFHPGQRFEHVIASDFNVRGRHSGAATAKHNALPRGLKKVVHNFVGAHGVLAKTSTDGL